MAQEPVRELLDLNAVHAFYIGVLQKRLGHAVPLPREADTSAPPERVEQSLDALRRWLAVLDLAITPPMVRDEFKTSVSKETSQALLRYYVSKHSHNEFETDKADCVVTFLFRTPWTDSLHKDTKLPQHGDAYEFTAKAALDFEAEIYRVLGDLPVPPLPDERKQLLREFEFLHQEVDDFRTFDQLMDSGIIQKVRDIKHTFGSSFYHPDVLATLAVYNVVFGRKFDELFKAATDQIKNFAQKVEQEGGSILSRVEGDITVKNLSDVQAQQAQMLNTEYHRAHEQFKKVSTFKKAVDKRRPAASASASAPAPPAMAAAASAAPAGRPAAPAPTAAAGIPNIVEEGKLNSLLDTVRSFVRVAQPGSYSVVPLIKGVLNITATEVEALRADYAHEKSFRADLANSVSRMMGMLARIVIETEEFRNKQNSSYLWKPHADSLAYLMALAPGVLDGAAQVQAIAEQRGLDEKAAGVKNTALKLRTEIQKVAAMLQEVGNR
jgi:hypothetical protein